MNRINTKTNWGVAAADINNNFDTVVAEIMKIKDATTKNKGYFTALEELEKQYPLPKVGDLAFVGTSLPLKIYIYQDEKWIENGTFDGGESVEAIKVALKDAIDQLTIHAQNFMPVKEDGWYFTDGKGNVITKVTDEGLDSQLIGPKLTELISNIAKIQAEIVASVLENLKSVVEDGFYLTDSNGNIGFAFDNDGLNANKINNNLLVLLSEKLSDIIDVKNLKSVVEDGFYLTDSNGNIGFAFDKNGLSTNKINNIPDVSRKKSVRILIVGNSFSIDAAAYLPKLLETNEDLDFVVGILYQGGQSLSGHVANFLSDAYYEYYEYKYSGYWTKSSKTIKQALSLHDWDIVVTQQVSQDSYDIESIDASLPTLINLITNYSDKKVRLGYILTPAYGESSSGWFEGMYDQINNVGIYLKNNYPLLEMIVPIHTAVQNARTNSLLKSVGADLFASASDRHIEDGIGRLIEAYTLYCSLNKICQNDIKLVDIDWLPISGENVVDGVGTNKSFPQTSQFAEISGEMRDKAIEAATYANIRPYVITKI